MSSHAFNYEPRNPRCTTPSRAPSIATAATRRAVPSCPPETKSPPPPPPRPSFFFELLSLISGDVVSLRQDNDNHIGSELLPRSSATYPRRAQLRVIPLSDKWNYARKVKTDIGAGPPPPLETQLKYNFRLIDGCCRTPLVKSPIHSPNFHLPS